MVIGYVREARYKLIDFLVTEHATDPENNPNKLLWTHKDWTSHGVSSMKEISSSLRTPKQTLDLIADHGGKLEGKHSYYEVVEGIYFKQGHSEVLKGLKEHPKGTNLPHSVRLPFEDYISMGRPEEITFRLELKPTRL